MRDKHWYQDSGGGIEVDWIHSEHAIEINSSKIKLFGSCYNTNKSLLFGRQGATFQAPLSFKTLQFCADNQTKDKELPLQREAPSCFDIQTEHRGFPQILKFSLSKFISHVKDANSVSVGIWVVAGVQVSH